MKDPRSILITGASGGIGAALARAYAAPGVAIALTGRNTGRLERMADACRAAGAEVRSATLDVTDAPGLRGWIERVDSARPLDLVIANAGITGDAPRDGTDDAFAEVDRMMRINFGGVCNAIHPALPAMRRRRRGQLALMSSLAAIRGLPYSAAYCASKAALKAYGEGLGAWLRPEGIEVSVILPGFVDTKLAGHVDGPKPLQMTAEKAARLIRRRLARGRPVIAFPFLLYAGARFAAALPTALAEPLLAAVAINIRRYE